MNIRIMITASALTLFAGLFPKQAKSDDAYDALLARIDYLQNEQYAWGELKQLIDNGDFDTFNSAIQVGVDYVTAMAPPPPYDDGSVFWAVTDVLMQMDMAVQSLDVAIQERLDAAEAAAIALDYEINGQYEDAVMQYFTAMYTGTMGFSMFSNDLWMLADAVDNANYWLNNWPEDPGMWP